MEFNFREIQYQGRSTSVPINIYNYRKLVLNSDEFRLIEILPAEAIDDTIRCRLSHHSLNEPPPYTALSYLWGDPSRWTTIEIDGTIFAIGRNLAAAMRQLRSNNCPLVWVDAICINQQDPDERDEFIPMMKRVYHNADYVTIWLGEEAQRSGVPMNLLRRISDTRWHAQSRVEEPYSLDREQLKIIQEPILALLRRHYWQRVWIIQEIASGSRVEILCGPLRADWRALDILTHILESDPSFDTTDFEAVRYLIRRRNLNLDGKQLGLLETLCDTRAAQATDNRDKVFAFLGLASDASHFIRSPSYRWTERETCIRMTESAVWAKKSLDIIFTAARSQPVDSLPSWVPDYINLGTSGYTSTLQSLSRYISGDDERWRAGNLRRRWNTTNCSVPTRSTIVHAHRLLRVPGIRFGTIDTLEGSTTDSPPSIACTSDSKATNLNPKNKSTHKTVHKLGAAYSLYSESYSTQKSSPSGVEYLWSFDEKMLFRHSSVKYLKERFQPLLKWRERNKQFPIQNKHLKDIHHFKAADAASIAERFATSYAVTATAMAALPCPCVMLALAPAAIAAGHYGTLVRPPVGLRECLDSLQDIIEEGMRLMTTVENEIGWAHPAARTGDELFLLQGCSMPAILRPSSKGDSTYTLVGHAYVEGFMNGELWSTLSEDQLEQVTIS